MKLQPIATTQTATVTAQTPTKSNYTKANTQSFGADMLFVKGAEEKTAQALSKLGTKDMWKDVVAKIKELKVDTKQGKPRDFKMFIQLDDGNNIRYITDTTSEGVKVSGMLNPPPINLCSPEMKAKMEGKTPLEQFYMMVQDVPKKLAEELKKVKDESKEYLLEQFSQKA